LTLFLAAFASACTPANFNPSALATMIPTHTLTDEMRVLRDPVDLAETFVQSLIELLVAESIQARDVARDALGSELSPRMYPILFRHLSRYHQLLICPCTRPHCLISSTIREIRSNPDPEWEDRYLPFMDQVSALTRDPLMHAHSRVPVHCDDEASDGQY
jgi:hypothetical protein